MCGVKRTSDVSLSLIYGTLGLKVYCTTGTLNLCGLQCFFTSGTLDPLGF